jgi:hypothetical protein
MGIKEKMRAVRARQDKAGGGNRKFTNFRDIFFDWQEGDNIVRFIGDFLEVKTHFIAPAPKRGDRGLCNADAFKGDYNEKLQMVINCPDWDVEKEEDKGTHDCPICKLNKMAKAILNDDPNDEEKETFKAIASATRARTALKWNVIDRNNPLITKKEGDSEEKVFGFKIATVGMEAFADIEGIVDQTGMDISDDEEGLDIIVTKTKKARWEYSAKAAMDTTVKPPTAKMTTLTDEERGAERHRLLERCGKQSDMQKVRDALHPDYLEYLELNEEDEPEAEAPAPTPEPDAPAEPKAEAPAPAEAPAETPEETPATPDPSPEVEEDDDDAFAGTQKKS